MILKLIKSNSLWVGVILILLLNACATISPATAEPTSPATGGPDMPVSNDNTTVVGPQAGSPLDPLPDEDKMTRGTLLVDKMDLLLLESYPLQVVLNVSGSLPTPCHHLRANFSQPNENNEIQVELYSLVDPDQVCIQVLQSFETSIPLGSFPDGDYTVLVNGEKAGEFSQ